MDSCPESVRAFRFREQKSSGGGSNGDRVFECNSGSSVVIVLDACEFISTIECGGWAD